MAEEKITKLGSRKAYDAGRALIRVQFPEDMPADKRKLGEHHSPWAGTDHPYDQDWQRGLRDAMLDQGDADERAALLKRLENVK